MARERFYTDRADDYPCGGCPHCGSGIIRLTLDTMVEQQWVYCYSCGCEYPATFDWNHYGINNADLFVKRGLTVGTAFYLARFGPVDRTRGTKPEARLQTY